VPAAIFVEVFVAGHFVRYILRASDAIFAVIARTRPNIECVILADSANVITELVGAGKSSTLAFFEAIRVASASYFSVSSRNYCRGLIPVFIYIQAIFARAVNRKRQVGSVHFESLAIADMTHAEEQ
jgi:hypothetical protein